jgi:glycosyltransferase involved in cell wall biosynthesis
MVTSSELRVPSDISGVSNGALKIINPSFLSDEQISAALLQSKAVFCLHEGVTQSGVFVECMRHSVPVIALDRVGFTQFIQNCGVVVSESKDLGELLASVRHIKEGEHLMVAACKHVYEQNFHLKNFTRFYGGFL